MARIAAVLIFVGVSVFGFSQQPPARDSQAVAVANESLSAMGAAALAQLNNDQLTLVASGTYVQYGGEHPVSYPFRVKVRGFNRVRWEFDRPDGTVATVFVGDAAWVIRDGKVSAVPLHTASGRVLERMPYLAVAAWVKSSQVSMEDSGNHDLVGLATKRVAIHKLPNKLGPPELTAAYREITRCEIDVDAQTLLPVRLRYYEHPGDWRVNIPMDLYFSNYKPVGGVLVPLTVARFLRNQPVDEYLFSVVEFNAQLDDSEFGEVK